VDDVGFFLKFSTRVGRLTHAIDNDSEQRPVIDDVAMDSSKRQRAARARGRRVTLTCGPDRIFKFKTKSKLDPI
jgi:hypothetical protein